MYQRLGERIRIIKTTTGITWNRIRQKSESLTVATFHQRAELTRPQRDILAKLDIPTPRKIVEAILAADA